MKARPAKPNQLPQAAPSLSAQLGAAALAAGGLAWMFKAGTILLTGWQPPQALEAG